MGFFVYNDHMNSTLRLAAFLFAAIVIVHAAALTWYLYWMFPVLNRLVHAAGGVFVALLVFDVIRRRKKPHILRVLGFVIAVGLAWEIFEAVIGETEEAYYAFDTAMDLGMDVFGGILGYFLGARLAARADVLQLRVHEGHSS